ncbi:MAG: hypothetical protein HZB33_04245 [Nitrospirae bacterium]|nr:hypothetical protein [Nitrospirota bacterium]
MTNRHYGPISFVILAVISLISCGGSGGAPGADPQNTGIMINSAILSMSSPDIDAFQNCCNETCTSVEVFTRESATLDVTTANLTPAITDAQFPAKIQECTITYLKANEDPAAPIIESLTIFPNCTLVEGTNSCDVTIIDITRKLQYSTPVIVDQTHMPAERPTHYVALMTCTYTSNFGKSGTFQAPLDIWLDNFNKC